jgi:hypothetical protein
MSHNFITMHGAKTKKKLMPSLNCMSRNYSGIISRLTMIAIFKHIEWSETASIDDG